MFKNYLKVALRTLRKHKGYSLINVVGLTLGLTCCLLIFQYVAYEYSFDTFNEHASNLYRVNITTSRDGGAPRTDALTGNAVGPALALAVPEVVRFARLHPDYQNPIISNPASPNKAFEETHVYYADPAFLQMFSYPLLSGDPERALTEPGTILLSGSAARKYFGDEDPLGQTLEVTGWIDGTFRVNGIFQDVPATSHLQFDVLLPMEDLLQKSGYNAPGTGWTWTNFNTYVQLRADADLGKVERTFTDVLLQNRGDDFWASGIEAHFDLQPLRDLHLNDGVFAPQTVVSSYQTVYFFIIIGLVTLLIALVNYVNLATARALNRAREVGVRKVVGAHRGQLIAQFLFESALTNLTAAVLAVVLADALRPVVNDLAETQFTSALWSTPGFLAAFLATFCTGTLLAGLYPAFVLSAFKPVAVLKGKAGSFGAQLWLRRSLVVLQFAASVVLVGGTAVVYQQLHYMRNMDLGIDLEQVLTVRGPQVLTKGTTGSMAAGTFTQEVRQLPAVRQIATSSALPGQGFDWYTSGIRRPKADPASGVAGAIAKVDTNFANLYGLELLAGNGFAGVPSATPEGEPIPLIVNETAIKALGFGSPAESINQLVHLSGNEGKIVGVFRDFNWSSAHTQRENIFFTLTDGSEQFSLKVHTENLPQTLAALERVYTSLFPGNPFRYAFLDEAFDEQYRNDQRFATLFTLFAALAIGIACLGLFGLASFTAQQRTKEIGIRKVLGASVPNLATLLSVDFLKLVGIAVGFGSPVAYFLMSRWIENFAYRAEIGVGTFVWAGVLALLIALMTVSYQAVKAALTDPVKSLRYE